MFNFGEFNFAKALCVSAALMSLGAAAARADALEERQQILEGFGKVTKPVGAMLKGQAPFDLAAVQRALQTYQDGAKKLIDLFPAGSDKGKTEASPKIWENKAKFDAAWKQFGGDAAAAAAAIKDEAAFKANFPKVLGDCKSCHDDFRIEK